VNSVVDARMQFVMLSFSRLELQRLMLRRYPRAYLAIVWMGLVFESTAIIGLRECWVL